MPRNRDITVTQKTTSVDVEQAQTPPTDVTVTEDQATAVAEQDVNRTDVDIFCSYYAGDMEIRNGTFATSTYTIHSVAGTTELDASNTEGTYVFYGTADVVDNSTGNATVLDQTLNAGDMELAKQSLAAQIWAAS